MLASSIHPSHAGLYPHAGPSTYPLGQPLYTTREELYTPALLTPSPLNDNQFGSPSHSVYDQGVSSQVSTPKNITMPRVRCSQGLRF